MAIFGLVVFVLAGYVPKETLWGDLSPIHTLGVLAGGKNVGIAFAVLGVLTMVGMANAGILSSSRFPFAMARDNLLPGIFGSVYPRFLTPVMSILMTAVTMAGAILFLDVERIAKLASAFVIMGFMGVNITLIFLREMTVPWYKPSYSAPLYPWLPLFGILSGCMLLVVMGPTAVVAGAAIALPGLLLYFGYGKWKVQRSGVVMKGMWQLRWLS